MLVTNKVEGAVNEHWLDKALRQKKPLYAVGQQHGARMSAEVILWLVNWKNEMLGIKRSIYEETLIYEEKNEQVL